MSKKKHKPVSRSKAVIKSSLDSSRLSHRVQVISDLPVAQWFSSLCVRVRSTGIFSSQMPCPHSPRNQFNWSGMGSRLLVFFKKFPEDSNIQPGLRTTDLINPFTCIGSPYNSPILHILYPTAFYTSPTGGSREHPKYKCPIIKSASFSQMYFLLFLFVLLHFRLRNITYIQKNA